MVFLPDGDGGSVQAFDLGQDERTRFFKVAAIRGGLPPFVGPRPVRPRLARFRIVVATLGCVAGSGTRHVACRVLVILCRHPTFGADLPLAFGQHITGGVGLRIASNWSGRAQRLHGFIQQQGGSVPAPVVADELFDASSHISRGTVNNGVRLQIQTVRFKSNIRSPQIGSHPRSGLKERMRTFHSDGDNDAKERMPVGPTRHGARRGRLKASTVSLKLDVA
ncbi:MAG: hypothetical protein ACN6PR_04815 [Achromobacter sp.]